MNYVPLAAGVLLVIAHYWSDDIEEKYHTYRSGLTSFAAGISVAYVFLSLFPELWLIAGAYTASSFLFVLAGFSLIYLIERHSMNHRTKKGREEVKEVHTIAFFVYHIIIGFVLVTIFMTSEKNGLLFFVPILLHTLVSSASLKEIHSTMRKNIPLKVLLSLSSLIGILLGIVFEISKEYEIALLGLIVGGFLYIVVKDEVSTNRETSPKFFVLGIVLFVAIIQLFSSLL